MHVVLSGATPAAPLQPSLEMHLGEIDPCTSLLELRGDLDLAAAPALKKMLGEWLEGRTHGDLVLALSGLNHIDSTGLAVLIAFRRRLPEGSRLAVAAPSRQVLRLLALTGLDHAVEVYASLQEACAELARTRRADGKLPLTADAAVAVGLAFTALAFGGGSLDAEAERWARILLPYGGPAIADELLDAFGGEAADAEPAPTNSAHDRLDRVVAHATAAANQRRCCAVRVADIVAGVIAVYGPSLRRALQALL
jgi:anti-anti-sigma factor